MHTHSLILKDGHLFVRLEGELWLLDTGSPTSFGKLQTIVIAMKQFTIANSYMGLSSETLSEFVGVQCSGLLGADVLRHFDHIFDCINEKLTVSQDDLTHKGQILHLSEFMGIPILTAHILGRQHKMFFDTGAQISYFQNDEITSFPSIGSITDFYPGVGQFETDTYQVDISFGGIDFALCCGTLPDLLGATLMMANAQGIIGNQIMNGRVIGYSPRRSTLYLQ